MYLNGQYNDKNQKRKKKKLANCAIGWVHNLKL